MNDHQEGLLSDIKDDIDSIDGTLKDQFSSVHGVGYAAQQSWMRLVDIKDATASIGTVVTVIALAAIVIAVTVVAHVIHHW